MSAVHPDAFHLRLAVQRMRRRLGTELLLRLLLYALSSGLLTVSVIHALASALALGIPRMVTLGILMLPLLAALGLAFLCWPSLLHTARTVDRLFALHARLATAIELTERPDTWDRRLARMQVSDALLAATRVLQRWPPLIARLRSALVVAMTAMMLATMPVAISSFGLDRLVPLGWDRTPREEPLADGMVAPELDPVAESASMYPESDLDELRALDPAAAQAVERVAAQRRALARLAQALGEISIGQAAAQAILQGEYRTAATELRALAENLDQLSPEAKRQLAAALARAAQDPISQGTRLAELERQAAQALAGSQYEMQRRALEELAAELARLALSVTSPGGDPPDELFDDYPMAGATDSGGSPQSAGGASGSGGERWHDGRATAGDTEAGSGTGSAGYTTSSSVIASERVEIGRQLGTPANAGGGGQRATMTLGQPAPRLETSGRPVEVPAQLTLGSSEPPPTGSGSRPALAVAAPVAVVPGVSGNQPALTPLPAEQNVVPSDRRHLIQEYFDGEGREHSP